MVCGTKSPDFRGLAVHHILGGNAGRSDETCNFLLVCGECHDLLEGKTIAKSGKDPIGLGMALCLKILRDPNGFDIKRLAVLNRERLPFLKEPAPWIEFAYSMNQKRRNPPELFTYPGNSDVMKSVNKWIDNYEITR